MTPSNKSARVVPTSIDAFDSEVRATAYLLWERDGKPHGGADAYWYQALDENIRARVAVDANADGSLVDVVTGKDG